MEQANGNEKRSLGKLIELLLEEPHIREKVCKDFALHKRDANHILVVVDTAKIRFGKYNWSGIGGFLNNLIKCYEQISFVDFFINVWDALVDMTVGTPSHEAVIEGLSRETLLKGIKNKEYDWICDRFFDVCRHLTKSGYWNPEGTKARPINHRDTDSDEVEIRVAKRNIGPTTHVRVVDSIGDPFEILNLRWTGGH